MSDNENDAKEIHIPPVVPSKPIEKQEENTEDEIQINDCCFVCRPENFIKRTVHSIVTYKYFDIFIMLVISGSSVALAAEDPVDENSDRNKFLNMLDYGFTAVFTVEMTLKVI